jgi:chitodextrinase
VIYVFPQRANCPWTGQGEMPGDESWINGDISVRVVAHELGHNMGVHHASSLRCWDAGGTRVTISGNCSRSEYGDPFDVMGSGSRRGGGWHLQQLGFLGAAQVGTVSASGSYTLNSITVPSGGLQLLRVPRIGTSDWYYLDFRTSGGVFDNFSLSDPVVKGVTVRMNPDPSVATQSNLLDGTPTSGGGFNDAPLPVGGSFSDGRISVTTAGVSGTTATVSVSFLDVTAPVAPVLTATASQTGAALGWSPSTDDRGVQGYRVMRNDRLLTTTTALTYRDANVKAGASYSYKVVAFDAAGNAGTSQPVRVTIPKPPPASPRSAGPSIRIRTPTANQRVNRVLQVRSTAADRSVANMELWIDGVKRKAVGGYTLNVALDMTKMPSGAHVVEIRAYDAHGAATSKKMGIRIVRESAAARKKRLGAKRKAAARRGSKARRRSTR